MTTPDPALVRVLHVDDDPGLAALVADQLERVGDGIEAVTEYSAEDGSGPGLSIVRSVAETHGWDVTVTEGQWGGARFEFAT